MKLSTRDLILAGLFAALTAVSSYISIPIGPVPITLQSLMVILSGIILGSKVGALSQITYVLLGLIGLPIFSGGSGGFDSIFHPTFGFLLSFILVAYIVGKITEKHKSYSNLIIAVTLGSLLMYIIGVPYFYFIFTSYMGKSITFYGALKMACIPFIPGDAVKAVISVALGKQLIRRLSRTSTTI